MAVPPLIAARAASDASQRASKAITGDIYTRRWTSVKGKGKKQRVVEHEAHLNPVTAGVGLAATAVGLGLAAWIFQLKLTPTRVNVYETVVDTPAYTETRPIPEVGHWADNTVPVGERVRQWIEGTWIRGTYKPGQWVYTQPVQTVPGQHWVVDVSEGADKIPHAAVTHQELVGTTKRFSIEQRQGFSSDTIFDAIGLGKPIFKPIFGKWLEGDFLRK